MAGSVTLTSSKVPASGGVRKYSIAWTSDASGAVSGNTVTLPSGTIVTVEFIPNSGGTQPTDLYDVDLLDDDGATMFSDGTASGKIGDNLSNAASSHRVPFVFGAASTTYVRAWLQGGLYTPTVANAGNAKGGSITVYVAPGVL